MHAGVPVWMRGQVCSEKGHLFVILTKVSHGQCWLWGHVRRESVPYIRGCGRSWEVERMATIFPIEEHGELTLASRFHYNQSISLNAGHSEPCWGL